MTRTTGGCRAVGGVANSSFVLGKREIGPCSAAKSGVEQTRTAASKANGIRIDTPSRSYRYASTPLPPQPNTRAPARLFEFRNRHFLSTVLHRNGSGARTIRWY